MFRQGIEDKPFLMVTPGALLTSCAVSDCSLADALLLDPRCVRLPTIWQSV